MKLISAILCFSVLALAAAEYGYYVPKGFYTINEQGEQSPLYFINYPQEALVHRLKRAADAQSQTFGSTSTSTGTGTGFFGQAPGFQAPLFPFPNLFPAGGAANNGGQSTFSGITTQTVSQGGDVGLNSRFGEDEPPKTQQTTTTIHGNGGQFTQTTHHFGPNGQHTQQTHTGKL